MRTPNLDLWDSVDGSCVHFRPNSEGCSQGGISVVNGVVKGYLLGGREVFRCGEPGGIVRPGMSEEVQMAMAAVEVAWEEEAVNYFTSLHTEAHEACSTPDCARRREWLSDYMRDKREIGEALGLTGHEALQHRNQLRVIRQLQQALSDKA